MAEQNLKFARMTAGTGRKSGAAIIAIKRGTEVFTEFDDAFIIAAGDALFICGTASSLEKYAKAYGATVAEKTSPKSA